MRWMRVNEGGLFDCARLYPPGLNHMTAGQYQAASPVSAQKQKSKYTLRDKSQA